MSTPFISIITPVFNAEKYLDEAIISVVKQDYQTWELIIVDDGSTDHSLAIALSWKAKDGRIKVLRYDGPSKSGAAKCRNFGLAHMAGTLVAFLDADDRWDSNFLSSQWAFMQQTKCPFVYASYRRYTPRKTDDYIVPGRTTYKDILKMNPITCLTVLIDTNAVGRPIMPEKAKYREDIACFYRLVREKTPYALGNPQVIATYRLHIGSVSYNKWKMIYYEWRLFRKVEKLGFFRSVGYMCHWVFSGLKYYRGLNRRPVKGAKPS